MPDDIILTDRDDVYVYDSDQWLTVQGRAGNDRITIRKNGSALGEQGNDVIINESGQPWPGAMYWNSPAAIFVDLEAGYALDGFGTRDTLVNIQQIHTGGHSGDTVYGSRLDDNVWINGFQWSSGTAFFDGRDGEDQVTMVVGSVKQPYQISVSADGREIWLSQNNFRAQVKNVEKIAIWSHEDWRSLEYSAVSFIDFSQVGPQTLLADPQHGWRQGGSGQGITLTYSFMASAPSYGGGEGGTGFQVPNTAYKSAVQQIFQRLESDIGVRFQEVADSATAYGQLRFGANQQTATKGYAFIPGTVQDARAGDVWLDLETLSLLGTGQEGWQVLLHEIGHALGLSHPLSEADTSGKVVLLDQWNWNGYTVMSETLGSNELFQEWFGQLDLQALRQIYGSGSNRASAGNSTYRLTDSSGESILTIADVDGWDKLDLSALSYGAFIDLSPSAISSAGFTSDGGLSWNNLIFSSGTVIEEIIGTNSDDVLIGSSADQVFHAMGGNDIINGGEGSDTVVLSGSLRDYSVALSEYTGRYQVVARDGLTGSVDLSGIEYLQFKDLRTSLLTEAPKVTLSGTRGTYSFRVDGSGEVLISGPEQGIVRDVDQVTFSDGQSARLMSLLPKAILSGSGPYDAKVQAYFITTLGRGATAEELQTLSSVLAKNQGSVWKDANGQTGTAGSLVGALFSMPEFQPIVEASADSQNFGVIVRDLYGRMTGGLVPDDDILSYYANQLASATIKLRGLPNAILNDLSLMPRADGVLSQPNSWKVNLFDQLTPNDYVRFLHQLELVGINVVNLDDSGTLFAV